MRTFFALLVVASLAGCMAGSPSSEDLAEDTAVEGKADLVEVTGLTSSLAALESPEIVFHAAPGLAAVQPTASLKFRYASCAARTWDVRRERQETFEGPRVLLEVVDSRGIDCFGPTISRNYDVQVTSDAFEDTSFVLLNPSVLSATRPTPECPDPSDPNVHYALNSNESPRVCLAAFIRCEDDQELFTNSCGCGCIDR